MLLSFDHKMKGDFSLKFIHCKMKFSGLSAKLIFFLKIITWFRKIKDDLSRRYGITLDRETFAKQEFFLWWKSNDEIEKT